MRWRTQLVARARKGEGPFFIELETYRYIGHHVGDINRAYYRPKDEEDALAGERDPIDLFGAWLAGEGIACRGELAHDPRRRSKPRPRRRWPMRSPPPFPTPPKWRCTSLSSPPSKPMRETHPVQGRQRGDAEEMRRDPTVFLIGEDVAEAGTSVQGASSGLVEEFGTRADDRHADLRARLSWASRSAPP